MYKEGDIADGMFFIKDGEFEVCKISMLLKYI